MICTPLVTSPVGWLILGLGGYALYRSGKKKGEKEAAASSLNEAAEKTSKETITTTTTKGAE